MKKTSDHALPPFTEESTKQILDTIHHSYIKSYSDKEKENIELKIKEL